MQKLRVDELANIHGGIHWLEALFLGVGCGLAIGGLASSGIGIVLVGAAVTTCGGGIAALIVDE